MRPFLGPPVPIPVQRLVYRANTALARPLSGAVFDRTDLAGVSTEVVRPPEGWREGAVVLYLHGGGFVVGSARGYRSLTSRLARSCGAEVYVPEYRLAPENSFPAPVDDCFAAYRALLEQGIEPRRIVIAGDSAGGNLALATTLEIGGMDLPLPAALVLVCPWLDLTMSAESNRVNSGSDPVLRAGWFKQTVPAYCGGMRSQDPRISPLFADLRNLPPTLLHVAGRDPLLDDGLRFVSRAEAARVDVTVERFDRLWHDFHCLAGLLDPADLAIDSIGEFVKKRVIV